MKVNSKQLRRRTIHATEAAAVKRSKRKRHIGLANILKSNYTESVDTETKIATTAFVTSHLGRAK